MRYYSSVASSKVLNALMSDSTTSMTLNNTTGLPTSYPYTLVIEPDTGNEEIVLVTAAAGTTLTVVRGTNTYADPDVGSIQGGNGTQAREHASGSVVKHMVTARDLQEPQNHIAAATVVHGLASGEGSVVGTDKTQTLTNKTLTAPVITGTISLPSTTSIGTVSSTEISYIDGVTSSVQTQLDAKAPKASPTFTGTVVLPSTTSIGNVSSTEIGYLDNVTSAIQTQLDAKVGATIVDAKGDIIAATGSDAVSRLAVGSNGQVLTADSSTATGLKWASSSSVVLKSGNDTASVGSDTTLFYTWSISFTGFSSAPKVMIIPKNTTSANGVEYYVGSTSTTGASGGVRSTGGSITFSFDWIAIGS